MQQDRKECVTEMVSIMSTDSPSSHYRGQGSSPRYRCMGLSSRVIMFLSLSCTVEGGSRASRTRTRQVPPQEGVCIFVVAVVVYIVH